MSNDIWALTVVGASLLRSYELEKLWQEKMEVMFQREELTAPHTLFNVVTYALQNHFFVGCDAPAL